MFKFYATTIEQKQERKIQNKIMTGQKKRMDSQVQEIQSQVIETESELTDEEEKVGLICFFINTHL